MNAWRCWAPALLGLLAMAAPARAAGRPFDELMKRVPDRANVLLLVDVDGLLDSPLGRRDDWRSKAAERPTGVLGLGGDASRLVVAAGVDLNDFNVRWKIGMAQPKGTPPRLSTLADREGGYVEQLETQSVAWTPRDFYLFTFGGGTPVIGFAAPADRQAMAGWIGQSLARPRTSAPGWADLAVNRANAGAQVVLAVNLARAIAPKQAEFWLRSTERDKAARGSADLLAQRLSTAKWAMVQVDVKETIQATLRVEFEYPVEFLNAQAKAIVLDLLADYGAELDDLKKWSGEAKGNTITLGGPLSPEALARLISVISAPRLAAHGSYADTPPTDEPEPTATKAAPPAPTGPDVVLRASQAHFRSVVDITQSLKTQPATAQRTSRSGTTGPPSRSRSCRS